MRSRCSAAAAGVAGAAFTMSPITRPELTRIPS